ncbi:MAG: hypothetical protein QOE59_2396, partial [Actinomycetota bacterium]|nr:hypothetical protein [Actinomycetota bacterium]
FLPLPMAVPSQRSQHPGAYLTADTRAGTATSKSHESRDNLRGKPGTDQGLANASADGDGR